MSKLYVNELVPRDASVITAPALDMSTVTMPPGSVIQVVQAIKRDNQSIASGSYVEINGLSVSITPKYATSKFLITAVVHTGMSGSNEGLHGRLYRNGAQITEARGTSTGSRDPAWFHCGAHYSDYEQYAVTATYLDTPNSSSAITYAVYGRGHSSPYVVWINTCGNNYDGDPNSATMSSITVMEIAQ